MIQPVQHNGVLRTTRIIAGKCNHLGATRLRSSSLRMSHSHASHHYAMWGEPWLFGVPDEGAAAYVRRNDSRSSLTRKRW
jgi:hypothetical protein